jgi:translation initiation factor 5A
MDSDLHCAREFLHSLAFDESTLSYLSYALDDYVDVGDSERRELFGLYMDDEDVEKLLLLFPSSSQESLSAAAFLPKAKQLSREEVAAASTQVSAEKAEDVEQDAESEAEQKEHSSVKEAKRVSAKFQRSTAKQAVAAEDSEEADALVQEGDGAGTYFQEAASIRRGEHVIIKDQPYRVSEVKSLGKRWSGPYTGCFRTQIVARGIFNGIKVDRIFPSNQNVTMASVKREEHTVIDIGEEGQVTLLTPRYDTKSDINLPRGAESDDQLADRIREAFDNGKTVAVIVLSACGIEKITQCKVAD